MSTASVGEASGPARAQTVRGLKARDNTTNFIYIAQVYLIMIVTIAATIWSYGLVADAGLGWWWNIPATFVAIVIIGASQHQLGGVIHEGTHYILFEDRKLNEIASDWLGAFPIYTSTHAFRLHHLSHHQFVNDPTRDPNMDQAHASGHWLDFPIHHIDFLVEIVKQLNPVRLVGYIVARARYSALGAGSNPYTKPDKSGSPWAIRVGVIFMVLMPFVQVGLIAAGKLGYANEGLMTGIALGLLAIACAATIIYYLFLPDEAYAESLINPVLSHRVTTISRVVYLTILFGALTITEYFTKAPVWGYYGLLWILPLFSTFPLFMVLREWIQHGNADRGRYTNSRVFIVNPILRYAVFPFGMDYHLPHHINASVPHYRLKDFHEYLVDKDEKYASKALVVEGWMQPEDTKGPPGIVDVLGPKYTPQGNRVHIDNDTLIDADINDKVAIAAQVEASQKEGDAAQRGPEDST